MTARRADPYRDLHVIDSRAPRTNQAVVGVVSVLAVATGWWWLLALLALQLAVGLTLGRRFCLPCLLYFEVIAAALRRRPARGLAAAARREHVGLAVSSAASVAYAAGQGTLGFGLGVAGRGSGAARGDHRLLHRLRGVQARLPAARAPVRLVSFAT